MKRRIPRRSQKRGFTLMEVLLVLAILVILGAVVVTNFSGAFSKAKVNTAKTQIRAFEDAIEFYAMDMGQPPTTQQGLLALRVAPADADQTKWGPDAYIKKDIPKDPWGNDYQYELIGASQYKIYSAGPDGQIGTDDDIESVSG